MLSSHLFVCLPPLLPDLKVPCKKNFFVRPDDRDTWPYLFSLRFLPIGRCTFYSPMACRILLLTSSLVSWSLYDMRKIFRKYLLYVACILLCISAERVHVSQAYREMDRTRGRMSLNLERRLMFLSFHIRFNLVSAAVVFVLLASISGLEPSSVIIDPRNLKLVTYSSF